MDHVDTIILTDTTPRGATALTVLLTGIDALRLALLLGVKVYSRNGFGLTATPTAKAIRAIRSGRATAACYVLPVASRVPWAA